MQTQARLDVRHPVGKRRRGLIVRHDCLLSV